MPKSLAERIEALTYASRDPNETEDLQSILASVRELERCAEGILACDCKLTQDELRAAISKTKGSTT